MMFRGASGQFSLRRFLRGSSSRGYASGVELNGFRWSFQQFAASASSSASGSFGGNRWAGGAGAVVGVIWAGAAAYGTMSFMLDKSWLNSGMHMAKHPKYEMGWDRERDFRISRWERWGGGGGGGGWNGNGKDSDWDALELQKNIGRKEIILIRHGQYDLSGATDEQKILTTLGRQQAKWTGERLAKILQ